MGGGTASIRLSEVVAALSYALDLTEGEPPGHAVRSCADRHAARAGARARRQRPAPTCSTRCCSRTPGARRTRPGWPRCSAPTTIVAKRTSKRIDWAGRCPAFVWSVRTVAPGGSLRARVQRLRAIKDEGEVTRSLMQARCDRGAEIALLIGLDDRDRRGDPRARRALGRPRPAARPARRGDPAAGAHPVPGPDGRDLPRRRRRRGGAGQVARKRSGGWFDPRLVDALGPSACDTDFWGALADMDVSPAGSPPTGCCTPTTPASTRIAFAFAGVIDAKSPWTYRHSDRASVIAASLAAALGADDDALSDLRRAALLHDVGKLAISNRILDKPGELTRERGRDHARAPARHRADPRARPGLQPRSRRSASAHHERLDGGGYPRGLDRPTTSTCRCACSPSPTSTRR